MAWLHKLIVILVVGAMSLGPMAATAADAAHHAGSVADAAAAHDGCTGHADEGQDQGSTSGDAHCALCCLAHGGYAYSDVATRIHVPVDWARVERLDPSGLRAPPQRAYGLMRPPRT